MTISASRSAREGAATRVGLLGFGAIGQALAQRVGAGSDGIVIVGAVVRDPSRSRPVEPPPLATRVEALLQARPEVVVEAGGHAALREHGPTVLRAGCDLLTVSVGALADDRLLDDLLAAARAGGSRIRVAAGAIGALDALSAAAVGGLDSVTHTTTKPARALLPAEEAEALTGPREVYAGAAREAVARYPESVNVMAAVSLAGIGFDRTRVRVVADPSATRNQHVVEAEGYFGAFRFEVRGVPTEQNPRTGRLVALSVYHELAKRHAPFSVG